MFIKQYGTGLKDIDSDNSDTSPEFNLLLDETRIILGDVIQINLYWFIGKQRINASKSNTNLTVQAVHTTCRENVESRLIFKSEKLSLKSNFLCNSMTDSKLNKNSGLEILGSIR